MTRRQLKLRCLIEGEYKAFPVTVKHNWDVGELKIQIKTACAVTLKDVDAHALELWKVSAIGDLRCEVTSLLSAQGPHRCEARQDFGCTYRVPGGWSVGICGHIRACGQRLQYLSNVAPQ
jgi:hypothetical protein